MRKHKSELNQIQLTSMTKENQRLHCCDKAAKSKPEILAVEAAGNVLRVSSFKREIIPEELEAAFVVFRIFRS
jgi:hypothetical protein